MSIHDAKCSPSLTDDHSRALSLFSDRLDARALFARHLNALQTPDRILWFHGEGGNGKSLLLRKLAQDYGRFLPDADRWPEVMRAERWAALGAQARHEAMAALDAALGGPRAHAVAWAALDFGGPGPLMQDLRQPVVALSELRRQLSAQGFRFPLFDYGVLLWLRHEGRLDKAALQQLFGSTQMDLLSQVLEVVADMPLVSAVPKLFKLVAGVALGRKIDGDLTQVLSRWKLAPDEAAQLARLHPAAELPQHLPRLLARDLNAAMTGPERPTPRLVLMFDTHEAFWGQDSRFDGRAALHARDEWLRLLLGALELGSGIVAVVASRDAPRWPDAPEGNAIPARHLHSHLLAGLDSPDADAYLQQAGVADAAMRQALLEVASSAGSSGTIQRQHHPLYLGLAAETWLAMRERGLRPDPTEFASQQFSDAPDRNGKGRLLLDRFFKYADDRTEDAVQVLAAARHFDWSLYTHLAGTLGLAPEHASFERLTRLSFVHRTTPSGRSVGVAHDEPASPYRIHDLARRILRARREPRLLQGDRALHAHYFAKAQAGDEAAIVEAIYHHAALDVTAAVENWHETFERAEERSRHALCQALGSLADELPFATPHQEAEVRWRIGGFWQGLSRHTLADEALNSARQLAEQALADAAVPTADLHLTLGKCLQALAYGMDLRSRHAPARQGYTDALASFERALALRPQEPIAWRKLGDTQRLQAKLAATLSQHAQARQGYSQAVASLREAAALAPEEPMAWYALGTAQAGEAMLLFKLSRHGPAQQRFEDAITSYRQVIQRAPQRAQGWMSLGVAQQGQAELLAALAEHEQAQRSYGDAVASYGRTLVLAPDDVWARSHLGNVQLRSGELLTALAQHEPALQQYGAAIASFRSVLERAPESVAAWNGLGVAEKLRADLLQMLSQHEAARQSYGMAIAHFRRVLDFAPDDVQVRANLGHSQLCEAAMLAKLSQSDLALQGYDLAIASYHQALVLAPDDISACMGLGAAQTRRAELLWQLSQYEQARAGYREAIASFGRLLGLAPNNAQTWKNLGTCQLSECMLLDALSQHGPSQQRFGEAIESFRKALAMAPQDVEARGLLGDAQLRQAGLLATRSRYAAAQQACREGIESYLAALSLSPEQLEVRVSLGGAQCSLADLLWTSSQHKQALQAYDEAAESIQRALASAPGHVSAWITLGITQYSRGRLFAGLSLHAQAQTAYEEAIAHVRHALTLAPDDVLAWSHLGIARQGIGELLAARECHAQAQQAFNDAIVCHRRVLALSPEHVPAWHNLGDSQRGQGDLLLAMGQREAAQQAYSDAEASVRRALEVAPEDVASWSTYGLTQQCQADVLKNLAQHRQALLGYGEACESLRRALVLAADSIAPTYTLAQVMMRMAESHSALHEAQQAEANFELAAAGAARARALAPADARVIGLQAAIAVAQARHAANAGTESKDNLRASAHSLMAEWRALAPADPGLKNLEAQWADLGCASRDSTAS